MRRTCFLEVLAGMLALLLGSTAAYILSGGYYSGAGVTLFAIISTLLLLIAACVLLLRISVHSRRAARHLYQQLPAEVACRLKRSRPLNLGVDELIHLTGEHMRAQQALLDEHYQWLFSQRERQGQALCGRVASESESTWQQLRGELSALEDQFATDMHLNRPDDPSISL